MGCGDAKVNITDAQEEPARVHAERNLRNVKSSKVLKVAIISMMFARLNCTILNLSAPPTP